MPSPVKSRYFFAALLGLLPFRAVAGDIQINGSCVLGTCPPPSGMTGALQLGQSLGPTMGSYDLMFADGDTYTISWIFTGSWAAGGGTGLGVPALYIDPTATYTRATPSVGNDVINFDFFQNFYNNSSGNWDGDYTENVPFSLLGNVAAGSTVSGQAFWDGQGLGFVGPNGPGDSLGTSSADLIGLDAPTLSAEFDFTYDFQAGTEMGASASASASTGVPEPAPEPGEAAPCGALLLAGLVWRRWAARTRRP
jgi:hypothetical protein